MIDNSDNIILNDACVKSRVPFFRVFIQNIYPSGKYTAGKFKKNCQKFLTLSFIAHKERLCVKEGRWKPYVAAYG